MTISEVIAALAAIQQEHGDLPVLHHDDWDYFVVETVQYYECNEPGGIEPPHVAIEGDRLIIDDDDGSLTEAYP